MKPKKKGVLIGLVIVIIAVAGLAFVAVSGVLQGHETFKNIGVKISTEKHTYKTGEDISGNFTLTNGRNETIYLAGYPSYRVDILSKSTLQPVCPSRDFAAILILLHTPISAHSTYNIYSPCVLYTADQNTSIPPGEYIIRVSFDVSLDLHGDSKNIDTFSGTAETTITIV